MFDQLGYALTGMAQAKPPLESQGADVAKPIAAAKNPETAGFHAVKRRKHNNPETYAP